MATQKNDDDDSVFECIKDAHDFQYNCFERKHACIKCGMPFERYDAAWRRRFG